MNTHTPGPWIVPHMARDDHPCECRYILGGDYMGSIATVSVLEGNNDCPPLEEARANARLIAAAPDLLEALEKIARRAAGPMPEDKPADWLRDLRHIEADARAALAKAGGAA